MLKPKHLIIALALPAALGLLLGSGCAGKQDNNARWLQRGEAEALLAAHAATPEKDPDTDRVPATTSELEAQGDIMAAQGSIYNAMNNYRLALKEAKGAERHRLEGKLAGLDLRLGRYSEAGKSFAALCAGQPDNAVFWQGQGLAQMGQGDLGQAEKSLSRAVELDPSLWRAQNLLGVIHDRRGQPRQAMAAFLAALEAQPNNPALYNNLALAQAMAGDLPGAEASLRRALSLDPEHRLAANNLGLLLARQRRDQEAFQVFAQAQGVAQAHNNLGVILSWQGRPAQAKEQFRLAVQTLPRYYPLASRHLKQLGSGQATSGQRLAAQPPVRPAPSPSARPKPAPKAIVKTTPQAKPAAKAPATPPEVKAEAATATHPAAQAQPSGKAQGLWMRADGSFSYGPMPPGEMPLGVVYGSAE